MKVGELCNSRYIIRVMGVRRCDGLTCGAKDGSKRTGGYKCTEDWCPARLGVSRMDMDLNMLYNIETRRNNYQAERVRYDNFSLPEISEGELCHGEFLAQVRKLPGKTNKYCALITGKRNRSDICSFRHCPFSYDQTLSKGEIDHLMITAEILWGVYPKNAVTWPLRRTK